MFSLNSPILLRNISHGSWVKNAIFKNERFKAYELSSIVRLYALNRFKLVLNHHKELFKLSVNFTLIKKEINLISSRLIINESKK